MKRSKLTAEFIRKDLKPGKYMDGGGLFLQVRKDGSKHWVHRFQMDKRRTDMGLGRYPTITISQAREKRDANERRIANGINPVSVKASATASMMKYYYHFIGSDHLPEDPKISVAILHLIDSYEHWCWAKGLPVFPIDEQDIRSFSKKEAGILNFYSLLRASLLDDFRIKAKEKGVNIDNEK